MRMVMEKGEVRETGNHDSLLEANGMYAKVYQMQFEKREVVA